MFLLYIAIKRVHFTPAFCCIHIIQLVVPLPHFAVDQVPPPITSTGPQSIPKPLV